MKNHSVKVGATEPADLMTMLMSEIKVGVAQRKWWRDWRNLSRVPGLEPRGEGGPGFPYLFSRPRWEA